MTERIYISCFFCPASWREKPLKPPDHTPTTTLKIVVKCGAVVRRTAGVEGRKLRKEEAGSWDENG